MSLCFIVIKIFKLVTDVFIVVICVAMIRLLFERIIRQSKRLIAVMTCINLVIGVLGTFL